MISLSDFPYLSVIVPIYGVEDYLEECIESIIAQTYTNIEINLSPLCIFKGNPVNVTCIKENVDFIADNTYILNPIFISSILYNLITYINYESSRKL